VTSALDPARWSRRRFLGATTVGLAAGVTGLAGCSAASGPTSPRSPDAGGPGGAGTASTAADGSPEPAVPSASVFPGSVDGAALEDALAAHAATLLAVGRDRLGKTGRRLVTGIRDQHTAHAAALRTNDPTDPNAEPAPTTGSVRPPPSNTPSGKRPGFVRAVDRLLMAETEAAVAHRGRALAADGLAALLWGSMAAAAGHIVAGVEAADLTGDDPDPGVALIRADRGRAPMPVLTVDQGEQEMVRQLHAVVYGYQLALGRLSGNRRDDAAAELRRHRILRDRLTARLIGRKAEVPVADAAYVPSTNPRNVATAAKLIRQMETALMPFCGLWLASAAAPAQRTEALGQLDRTTSVARTWGASLPAWPGWKPA
jgi:hypothetical protein